MVRWRQATDALTERGRLWYSTGFAPLQIRYVLVRDPKAKLKTMTYFSTAVSMSSLSIVADFVKRWNTLVTFEESQAHLGVETQRQFNHLAIERTTPLLLGMYSLVCLFANAMHPAGEIPVMQTAWYAKSSATFLDLLAAVRKAFWGDFNFQTMPSQPENLFSAEKCTRPTGLRRLLLT
jgi:hypothetical protein